MSLSRALSTNIQFFFCFVLLWRYKYCSERWHFLAWCHGWHFFRAPRVIIYCLNNLYFIYYYRDVPGESAEKNYLRSKGKPAMNRGSDRWTVIKRGLTVYLINYAISTTWETTPSARLARTECDPSGWSPRSVGPNVPFAAAQRPW